MNKKLRKINPYAKLINKMKAKKSKLMQARNKINQVNEDENNEDEEINENEENNENEKNDVDIHKNEQPVDDQETEEEHDDDGKNEEKAEKTEDIENVEEDVENVEENEEDAEENDENGDQDERQTLLNELKEQLVPCSRKLITENLIDHVFWFDKDNDSVEYLWVAKIEDNNFEETLNESKLLVTWPGYGDEESQYWISAYYKGKCHAYQVSKVVLNEKYKSLLYPDNLNVCMDIVKNASKPIPEVSDNQDEN